MMFAIRISLAFRPAFRSTARSFTSTAARASPFAFRAPIHQGSRHLTQLHSTSRQRVDWQATWNRSRRTRDQQRRGYGRQAFNYQRFNSTSGILRRWAARPTFYYEIGGIAIVVSGVYTYNLETVEVSGRRRFNIISANDEAELGAQMYKETMQEFGRKLMPPHSKEHRQVQRVLDRLVPHSGLQGESWEIHVIDDDITNAFVLPGGKVFVFRGILDICQGDDGLAAVLGHEIAHNVAHHAAERMSQSFVLLALTWIAYGAFGVDFGIGRLVTDLAFSLPGSRAQEQEADYIGLLMMAESCYDPHAALGLWARMEKEEQGAPPQFLSTHPSSHNRLEKIKGWLPEAEVKRESGDCYAMSPFVNDFKSVADFSRWPELKTNDVTSERP